MTTIKVIAAKPEKSGDLIMTLGTRLFVNDTEITNLESLSFNTNFGDANETPRTTLTFTVVGTVVDMERVEGSAP